MVRATLFDERKFSDVRCACFSARTIFVGARYCDISSGGPRRMGVVALTFAIAASSVD